MSETELKPVTAPRSFAVRCRSMAAAGADRLRWIWRHRTKTIGGLGVVAGAVQYQLANHPEIKLPHEGVLLMCFGGVVSIVGTYNSLADFFGWRDPQ